MPANRDDPRQNLKKFVGSTAKNHTARFRALSSQISICFWIREMSRGEQFIPRPITAFHLLLAEILLC